MSEGDEQTGVLSRIPKDTSDLFNKINVLFKELNDYLESNRHLFTLIGVFAAIGLYIQDPRIDGILSTTRDWVQFLSFSIVFLLYIVGAWDLLTRILESEKSWLSYENFGLVLFGVLFTLLFSGILSVIFTFDKVVSGVLTFLMFSVGTVASIVTLSLIADILKILDIKRTSVTVATLTALLLILLSIEGYTTIAADYTVQSSSGMGPVYYLESFYVGYMSFLVVLILFILTLWIGQTLIGLSRSMIHKISRIIG